MALRVAVIGAGHFGRFHAEKYAAAEGVALSHVVDRDETRARELAIRLGAAACTDHRDILGVVDAVSVVVPTPAHFAVARDCLAHGVHVLVEKPITATLEEADALIALARTKGCILQVGHLERFSAVSLALAPIIRDPAFIECHRIAPFKPRGTDVNVILDLMIHDIDMIQAMVGASLEEVQAMGVAVLSAGEDIANARLSFANGCVANVTASRVSLKTERKIRIFQPDAYISIDFHNKRYTVARKGSGEMFPGVPDISVEDRSYEEGDSLAREIEAFIASVRTGGRPLVSGDDGRRALATALRITDALRGGTAPRARARGGA